MTSEAVLLAILAVEKLLFAGAEIITALQKNSGITDEELITARQRRQDLVEQMHQVGKGENDASTSSDGT